MRAVLISLMLVSGPSVGLAQSADTVDCVAQAKLVMEAVSARSDGASKAKARRPLRDTLGRSAGDALADWIYSLPQDQLTADVGTAWETQCKAL